MTTTGQEPAAQPPGVVRRPAEVLRLAMATREVLEALRTDDLTEAARRRATAIYDRSVEELGDVLPDELREELASLVPSRGDRAPSASELRVIDAQLSGWLEGLLQTMRAAMEVQRQEVQQAQDQSAARAADQAENERWRRGTSYL